MKHLILLYFSFLINLSLFSQNKTDANVFGDVRSDGEHLPFANVFIKGTTIGVNTDATGHFLLTNLPLGKHLLLATMLGYDTAMIEINAIQNKTQEINFELHRISLELDAVVVSAQETARKRNQDPISMDVLNSKTIELLQANTISEGLCFQPGLRMEVDCQTCNYSQLRMNGLGGSYSQILINGRPIFSPLVGMYGLEQLPSNLVERVEIIRGGGSALFNANAIGGSVNIITRVPEKNDYDISFYQGLINGNASDNILNANLSLLNDSRNSGVTIFASRRERQSYDHNADGFSELPQLRNNTFGFNWFVLPADHHKIELSVNSVYEYRRGGDKLNEAAVMGEQGEERTHNILNAGLDYVWDISTSQSLSVYLSGSDIKRKHYTGSIPDDSAQRIEHFLLPPYGYTTNKTGIGGLQYKHVFDEFPLGKNTFIIGTEIQYDKVLDSIAAYHYNIDQQTEVWSSFMQSYWELTSRTQLQAGVRIEKHNYLSDFRAIPRLTLMYKAGKYAQLRGSYSSGYKAPVYFDTDMHMAFSGGGIQSIRLNPLLKPETSNSFSASINYDKPSGQSIFGFTLEGFYTRLINTFALELISTDSSGNSLLEKNNNQGSEVMGGTIELRANRNNKLEWELGITFQKSLYKDVVTWSEEITGSRYYLRTPERYGYASVVYSPSKQINLSLSTVYTGPMNVAHYAGAIGITSDRLIKTKDFFDTGIRTAYILRFRKTSQKIELFVGVKNILNDYQKDFDSGKNRDSNYIYGPAQPRTLYAGIKVMAW